jgi:hypothetical protein
MAKITKQLLVESLTVDPREIRRSGGKYLVEQRGGKMVVTLPATKCDFKNLNERNYSSALMEGVSKRSAQAFESRELLSSVNEHPAEPYVTPGQASHVVIGAWVENGVFYNEWEILETASGRDLRALIEAEVSFGVSIRGLGSVDYQGNILEDYEFLGTDCVAEPSASLRVRPTIKQQKREGHTMTRDKAGTLRWLNEQKILMDREAEGPDKIAVLQRAAAVEVALSECELGGRDLAEVYQSWKEIKDSAVKLINESKVDPAEAARSAELFEKLLARRNGQVKAMATGIAHMGQQVKQTKEIAAEQVRQAGLRVKAAQDRAARDAGVARGLQEALVAAEGRAEGLLALATEGRMAYRVAVREAARINVAYKFAVTEAAALAKGRKLIVRETAAPAPTVQADLAFFAEADRLAYPGADRPFGGSMEPMAAEGVNYRAVLSGAADGKTVLQIMREGGPAHSRQVGSFAELRAIALPESVDDAWLAANGFAAIAEDASVRGSLTEAKRVINNAQDRSKTPAEAPPSRYGAAYERGEVAFKGWL